MAKKTDQTQVRNVVRYFVYGAFLVLFIFSISSCCISERNSANEQDDDKIRTDNDKIVGRKKSDLRRLATLATEDILTNTNIFNDLYFLHSQEKLIICDKEIELELYNKKYKELIYHENIPSSIIVAKGDSKEIKIPISSYRPLDKIRYIIPKTHESILCIENPSGGNGWNAHPEYVISLEHKHFFKNPGQVSGVRDIDKDGIDELIRYDDIWELGLGYLCHADAPGARIILSIEKNKIVPDISNNINYYQDEIVRINSEIKKFPKGVPREMNQQLLSLILQKFLIYRLLGNIEKGWEEFNKDIRHHDDKFFYLYEGQRKGGLDKIPISEIKNKMSESLRDRQR